MGKPQQLQGTSWTLCKQQSSKLLQIGSEFDGTPLYACRVYHQGDIIPGKWHTASKNCDVAYGGRETVKSVNQEVEARILMIIR